MSNAMRRVLRLRSGPDQLDVVVNIHWPVQQENSWFADWTIGWPDRVRKGSAGGVDAIQAMLVAINIVGTEFYSSEEHQAGRLSWVDDWSGNGFPVPKLMRDTLKGDDAKYY